MFDKNLVEDSTRAFIRAYKIALEETENPNLAYQIAGSVLMVLNMNKPQQTINPIELMAAIFASQKQNDDSEDGNEK